MHGLDILLYIYMYLETVNPPTTWEFSLLGRFILQFFAVLPSFFLAPSLSPHFPFSLTFYSAENDDKRE